MGSSAFRHVRFLHQIVFLSPSPLSESFVTGGTGEP
jgi:hypothetical protein